MRNICRNCWISFDLRKEGSSAAELRSLSRVRYCTDECRRQKKRRSHSEWAKAHYSAHPVSPEETLRRKKFRQSRKTIEQRYWSSLKGCFKHCKQRAKLSDIPFLMTFPEYAEILKAATCHYCGGVLPPTGGRLDRCDSSKGYSKGNVVPCCSDCNFMKRGLNTHEFYSRIELILSRRAGK